MFSETADGIYYLHNYYPKRYEKNDKDSANILEFKNGNDSVIEAYAKAMKEAMDAKYDTDTLRGGYVCVTPSHHEGLYSKGLLRICAYICECYGMINAAGMVIRKKQHSQASHGGDRSIKSHLDTLSFDSSYDIKGKKVIMLDDVTTTGNSLAAMWQIIHDNGADQIFAQVLAKTINEYNPEEITYEWPMDYYVQIAKSEADTNGRNVLIETSIKPVMRRTPEINKAKATSNNKSVSHKTATTKAYEKPSINAGLQIPFPKTANNKSDRRPAERLEFKLDGETYYYKRGEWYTSRMVKAPRDIVGKLNKLLTAKRIADRIKK